jgi:hypothetical protein
MAEYLSQTIVLTFAKKSSICQTNQIDRVLIAFTITHPVGEIIMSHIFISYSRRDLDFVDNFAKRLRRRNFRIWIDRSDIKSGTNWRDAIQMAIKESSAIIVILSEESLKSEWVDIEWNEALDVGKPVICYLHGISAEKLPPRLKKYNVLDGSNDEAFDKLIADLPPSAHTHETSILHEGGITNRKAKFSEIAEGLSGVIRPQISLEDGAESVTLIGLPLKYTQYCMTYLVGLPEDTLQWKKDILLGLQFSQAYPGNSFVADIFKYFLQKNPKASPHLLLVRGPLKVNFNPNNQRYSQAYGLDPQAKDEWQDAVYATEEALQSYHREMNKPALRLFMLAPNALAYQIGLSHRGFYETEVYQFDLDTRAYYPVYGELG